MRTDQNTTVLIGARWQTLAEILCPLVHAMPKHTAAAMAERVAAWGQLVIHGGAVIKHKTLALPLCCDVHNPQTRRRYKRCPEPLSQFMKKRLLLCTQRRTLQPDRM